MGNLFSKLNIRWHFRNESKQAQQLANEQPKRWEYLLTAQLLNDWLTKWKPVFDKPWPDDTNGRSFTCDPEFQYWMPTLPMKLLAGIEEYVVPVICKELTAAWGAPRQNGNAVLIRNTVAKLDYSCRKMLEWKSEAATAQFPNKRKKLRSLIIGWERLPLEFVEEYKDKMSAMLSDSSRTGAQHIQITLHSLPRWDEFQAEFERVTNSLPENDTYATPEAVAQKHELDRMLARTSKQ